MPCLIVRQTAVKTRSRQSWLTLSKEIHPKTSKGDRLSPIEVSSIEALEIENRTADSCETAVRCGTVVERL